MRKNKNPIPVSINYHITQRCNYCCKFCFARYGNCQEELTLIESKLLIEELVSNGCEKINFAGGEPTLISHLPELINYAKESDLFVSLISNGTGISKKFINSCGFSLDLIGLSIDSVSTITEKTLGRTAVSKHKEEFDYSHVDLIIKKAKLLNKNNIDLKINTTITSINWNEDMNDFILELDPVRWKIFEVHYLEGINTKFFNEFGSLEPLQFEFFVNNHSSLNPVVETSDSILESYCMITPDGRFYQDSEHRHNYSDHILKIGATKAFNQVQFSDEKFNSRDAVYFRSI